MKVHVLVEGSSERAFIDRWAPRAFPGHQFVVHPHQGKGTLPRDLAATPDPRHRGLLDLLPATLRAYSATTAMVADGVLVIVDLDDDERAKVEARLVEVAETALPLRVVIRLAIEELEAFYLGDLKALKAAFPEANMVLATEYVPDSIVGTAELFGQIIDDDGLRKVSWAEQMGARLTTVGARSRSPSFKALHASIRELVKVSAKSKTPRKKHWKSRHSSLRKANS
ncbi:MAG: DUF4276 family protein [Kofleriaceae bacterium]